MTFWGFVLLALIVFVAFYAWFRYARNNREIGASTDAMRRVDRTVNRPLLTETGMIGEREGELADAHHLHAQPHPVGAKGPRVNTYLTEVGMIGQLTQGQPQLLLPPPREDFSAETGTIGERDEASVSDTHAAYIHPNRSNTDPQIKQADLNPNKTAMHSTTVHAQHNAVASENVGSNLSQVQRLSDDFGEAAWLENSDLVRLHGEPEPSYNRAQNGDEVFDLAVGYVGHFLNEEIGTIGERKIDQPPYPFDQAPRNKARRGYVHQPDVEFGADCHNPNEFGLNTLPDQLPIADNQAHTD